MIPAPAPTLKIKVYVSDCKVVCSFKRVGFSEPSVELPAPMLKLRGGGFKNYSVKSSLKFELLTVGDSSGK